MSGADHLAAWQILQKFVTEEVWSLVRGRVLEGQKFFGTTALRPGLKRDDVKLALLLVRIANPTECFTDAEKALLTNPLRPLRQRKDNATSAETASAGETEIKATKPKGRKPRVS